MKAGYPVSFTLYFKDIASRDVFVGDLLDGQGEGMARYTLVRAGSSISEVLVDPFTSDDVGLDEPLTEDDDDTEDDS
jgi:hypothetical protein